MTTSTTIVKLFAVAVLHTDGIETLYVKEVSPKWAMLRAEDVMRDRHDGRGYDVLSAEQVDMP